MFRSFSLFLLLALVLVSGCTNHDLERCRQFDKAGDFKAAVPACEEARKIPRDADQTTPLLACVRAAVDCSKDDADLEKTVEACETAVSKGKDTRPRCAADAAERLVVLKPKLDQLRAEVASKKAAGDAEALKAARSKVRGKNGKLEADATCTGKGLPPYRVFYEGGTFEEDAVVAQADGCRHLHEPGRGDARDTDFCCPSLIKRSADLMNNNW